MNFRWNKSEICCFEEKENEKKKYISKNDERIIILIVQVNQKPKLYKPELAKLDRD